MGVAEPKSLGCAYLTGGHNLEIGNILLRKLCSSIRVQNILTGAKFFGFGLILFINKI